MTDGPLLESNCPKLKLIARGKVRDLYDIDQDSLLFVATDRISAYDCIMKTGIPSKGKILTQISCFWFELLKDIVPNHLITTDLNQMPLIVQEYKDQLEERVMLVKKCKILPIEAIVRGYITGSAMSEYKKKQSICDIPLPHGLVEADALTEPLFTPSTKAEIGQHDENIHPSKMESIIGKEYSLEIQEKSLKIYSQAKDYALSKGIIIADTKFEFGIDQNGQFILVDEVLTPDSSRFWSLKEYTPGKTQPSFDKQFLRDYLTSISFDKKQGIELPSHVVSETLSKYKEAFRILTGKDPIL